MSTFKFGCVFHCVTQKSQSAYLRCKTLPSPPLRKPASHSGLLLYKTKCLQLESPLQTGLHVSPCAGSLEQRQPLFHSPSAQGQTRQRHSCGQERRSLAASKCLSRQVHPDGGCRVLNPPGFPSQHSSSIKNTCQSQKVHLGPDSQGSPVLCAGCL